MVDPDDPDRENGENLPLIVNASVLLIFCTIGEEWGFIGSAGLVLLFSLFIARIFYKAERQKSRFSRVYGYSVGCIFMIHLLVNVGMTLGIMPTIGIPLPFFSYGGSSLWGFTLLLFIFIKLDAVGERPL